MIAQLSSKEDYAYFFRTIPTELMFPGVMLDFVVSRGWKSVAVFYTGDNLGSESKEFKAFQRPKRAWEGSLSKLILHFLFFVHFLHSAG